MDTGRVSVSQPVSNLASSVDATCCNQLSRLLCANTDWGSPYSYTLCVQWPSRGLIIAKLAGDAAQRQDNQPDTLPVVCPWTVA